MRAQWAAAYFIDTWLYLCGTEPLARKTNAVLFVLVHKIIFTDVPSMLRNSNRLRFASQIEAGDLMS